jgi:hypothetical protein
MLQLPPEGTPSLNLILASDHSGALGVDVRVRRRAERGALHRVSRGAYVPAGIWGSLDEGQRYAVRVRSAALARRGGAVVSHQSAAVLWGLPLLSRWPAEVHFLTERATGGRSDPGIRKHALGITAADVTLLDGILLTTLERTVVDMAATVDLKSAVAIVDRALLMDPFGRVQPLTTRARLLETWERMLPFRGSVRARAIIEFGSGLSGSPLESGSRVNIALNGFPIPELQYPFDIDGRTVRTDFYWLGHDCIGEADGRGKYFDERLLVGLSIEEVIFAEKQREDALRRQVRGFTRWDAAVGLSQQRLRSRLLQSGLPSGRPWLLRG